MENIEPHSSDSELIALREKIEDWLIEYGEYVDEAEEIAANNITLWAQLFLKISEQDGQEAADRLRLEGAKDFVARVRCSAGDVIQSIPGVDSKEVTLNAYAMEVLRLYDL